MNAHAGKCSGGASLFDNTMEARTLVVQLLPKFADSFLPSA
jgi:hypothetical protein